jgi:3D (Asp-Asp-Asp) domain-containing protein
VKKATERQNMSLFKQKIVRSGTKIAISLVAIFNMIGALVAPTIANASFFDFAFSSSSAKEVSFPVAEGRQPARTMWVVVTAYSSTVDQCDDTPCITANGYDLCTNYEKYAIADTVAANFLRMGETVRFPDLYGDKVFTVRDRMNARYGNGRLDIWMPTREMAKNFGVKRIKMEIY